MKKSTLLLGLALIGGTALSGSAQEMIRGIKITPDNAPAAERYYYRISNMRVQRLNYSTGDVAGFDDATGEADWEDIFMVDGSTKNVCLPLFLPGGFPEDWETYTGAAYAEFNPEDYEEGTYQLTPQPYTRPYMGLALVEGSFFCAFSAQQEVMDQNTIYWYFTKGSTGQTVRIHNAVLDGTIKRNSDVALGRKNLGFDTKENNYNVIGLRALFEEEGFDMALTEEQLESAFALSTSATIGASSCVDQNNYITYNYVTPRLGEDGQPLLNDEGEEINLNYGYAGVDRTWSPLANNGSNENHLYNNGSTFFVNDAETADALAAIEAYKDVVAKAYRDAAIAGAKAEYAAVANQIKGWANVPALWKDQTTLAAIIAECENWNGTAESVNDLASQEAYIAEAKKAAYGKQIQAAKLVGTGAVVTFQNLTAFRDIQSFYDEEVEEELVPVNAYISAGMPGSYNNGTVEEADYTGIAPVAEADKKCEWELIPVEGTIDFLLYNAETKTYIRKYVDMMELAGGEDVVGAEAYEFSWATTEDPAMAAPFHFIGCPDAEEQAAPTEDQEMLIMDYEIPTDIENNVRLQSTLEIPVMVEDETTGEMVQQKDEDGNPVFQTTNFNIHRGSANSDYKFLNWTYTVNNWYADTNAFHVGVLVAGGIDEIEAATPAKATGIYDLQGRKVAKAGKGLYIINGVKTIVK